MKRDGFNVSLWGALPSYQPLSPGLSEEIYDVAIVGGGITGITTALQLAKAGKKCVVLEAQEIGFGTTGGTTAHLNTLLDSSYADIEKNFSEKAAQMIADLSRNSIELIKRNVDEYNIDCGFLPRSAYLCAKDDDQVKELKEIHDAAKKYISVVYTKDVPANTPFKKAMEVKGQAQFHPLRYLQRIAQEFEKLGGTIWHNRRVTDVTKAEDGVLDVLISQQKVRARALIYATHIPPGVNVLHFLCAPYRSYAIAVRLKDKNYPDGLVYDLDDPYHYFRTQEIDGKSYLIAGGEDHKTGHEQNTNKCFTQLESYVMKYYDIDEITHRWSSQYYEPADGLPYIGHLPGNPDNVFVATGFGGNGMIYGTASAMILTDIICSGKSEYRDLLSPARVKPVAELPNVTKENADVAKEMITGWLSISKLEELAGLAKGEAKVVKYESNRIALYKDDKGSLHAVSPACPHIGCSVSWNNSEKSWDCPCHGSRFSYTGELLCAPSRADLHSIDLSDQEHSIDQDTHPSVP